MRSRSETVSSSASLRQRRQGFVPTRSRATVDLNSVTEATNEVPDRFSQASTIKATHTRGTSSVSTVNSLLAPSNDGMSSGFTSPTGSPTTGPLALHYSFSTSSTIAVSRDRLDSSELVRGARRLVLTLHQLKGPIAEVILFMNDHHAKAKLHRLAVEAHARAGDLNGLLGNLGIRSQDLNTIQVIVRGSVGALRSYGTAIAELKRNSSRLIRSAENIYVHGLMLQMYSTMIEVRNICTILGFKVKERSMRRNTPRISQTFSSKSVTPTQPKAPSERRVRRQTGLPSNATTATIRAMAPPPVPLNGNVSRTNTMTSMSAATPRSGESFPPLPPPRSIMSRSNTMRSVMDTGDTGEQFERIFFKLKGACDQAAEALPQCRVEFNGRRDTAQAVGQRSQVQQWSVALQKCDIAITHTKTLKKRLALVKVNDLGVQYQRDFWQMCDAFVHVSH